MEIRNFACVAQGAAATFLLRENANFFAASPKGDAASEQAA